MSHPEPPRPGSRIGDAVVARTPAEPSLAVLMGRIRFELTGSEEDVLRSDRIGGEATAARADAAELEAGALSLDEVVNRIRRELKHRRGEGSGSESDSATSAPVQGGLPRWQSSVTPLSIQSTYVLADMLRTSDGEFVDNAFRILLRRSASVEEKAHYLAELRGGISKVEILGNIRFSDEGMRHSVHVDGLLIPYKLHKWRHVPVLGWFLATAIALFRLPKLFAHLQRLEAASAQESQHVGHVLNDLAQAVENRQTSFNEQLDTVARAQQRVQATLADQMSVLTSNIDHLQQQLAVQASASARVETRLDKLEQLESVMMSRLESVQKSVSQQAAEQVTELESAMMSRLESLQKALSEQAAEQVTELDSAMTSRLESVQKALFEHAAEQVAELESVMMSRLESVQQLVSKQAAEQVAELESAMTSRLESVHKSLFEQAAERVAELDSAIMSRLESLQQSFSEQAAGQVAELESAMMSQLESVRMSLSAQAGARLEKVEQLEAATTARLEAAQAYQTAANAQLVSRLDAGLAAVAKTTAEGAGIQRTVRDIERQLMVLFDRMNRQATGSSLAPAPPRLDEDQANTGPLAAHYVSFEDTFRGTRDDIKERSGQYLTVFRDAGIEAGDGLIIDIGCGRGEWLEVLSENGYTCRGVDMNSVMVREALALGLDVVEQDAIAYLRDLESESVSAVTSMHLVEHLSYEALVRLLDEALRVLRPGGVLILETPNPENLIVSSYWFYMDPTHRNPIPPPLLQWVAEARGFEGAAVERLTLNRGVFDIHPVGEDVAGASQINQIVGLLTAAPDYAIVARKPLASISHGQGA